MDILQSCLISTITPSGNFSLTSVVSQPIMHSLSSLLMVGSLALQVVFGLPDPSRVKEREAELLKRSVDSFVATESPIALRDMLCNIGSAGACVSGAASGLVIASPDKTNPDCTTPLSCSLCSLGSDGISRFLYVDSGQCLDFQNHCGYLH